MNYRLPKLETPADAPFSNDALERAETVEFLSGVIERAGEQPLVLAIDARYGSGKSTFVDMLRLVLAKKNFQTVYFDAWRADHVNDPLVAMVAALDEIVPKEAGVRDKVRASLGVVRKVAGTVAKRGVVAAVKVATVGAVDLEDDVEEILRDFAGETTTDLVGEFQKEEKLIFGFREALQKVVKQLPDAGKNKTLVFFIDELDRCRPDFAISLLERVKHMFDVPNIVFILSVDKAQLEAATAAIYGERINAAEYLRKFIDLEFGLPEPRSDRFLDTALTRAGLDEIFEARAGSAETRSDRKQFVNIMFALARIFDLSLRAQERCITRLKLVLEQTPSDSYLDPEHVALLIVLRLVDQSMFERVVKGTVSPEVLLQYMQTTPERAEVLNSDDGRILRAMVFAEDRDDERRKRRIAELEQRAKASNLSGEEHMAIVNEVDLIRHFSHWRSRRAGWAFKQAARKIDIASRIRE
jgi:hypothetical protein